MPYVQKYYFFRCYHCGEWFYTNRRIKSKKCWKCNHSFQFINSKKFVKTCTTQNAIKLIKDLKEQKQSKILLKYLET